MRRSLTLKLLLVWFMAITHAYADVVVVVSAKNPLSSLTSDQAARIFLGKTDTFPDGSPALPVDLPDGSSVRDEFYAKVVHKTPSQLTAYWSKVVFTGEGRPPKLLESSAAVRKAVAKNLEAIGYLDKSAVDSSVKVIFVP